MIRTLKDLKIEEAHRPEFVLRYAAIEHIKYKKLVLKECKTLSKEQIIGLNSQILWIIHFFNLKKSDLK